MDNVPMDGMEISNTNSERERAQRANAIQSQEIEMVEEMRYEPMMYNSELTDELYHQKSEVHSPSKESYRFGMADNKVLMTSDYPDNWDVNKTDFGSWMHLIEEYAVEHKLSDYMTIRDMLVEHEDYLELTAEQEEYAITIFERFLAEIDLTANYLTEHFVEGWFLGKYYEGTADLIELHDDNTFTMIDYKHYSKLTEEDLLAHKTQCAIYASLYQKETGIILREIKVLYPMEQHVEREVY